MSMRAHQIMSREVITIGVDAAITEAIAIMLSHHVGGLPVVDAGSRLVGIVSEGDFIRRAEIGTERKRGRWLTLLAGADRVALDFARTHGRKVGQIMTANPVTIAEDTPLTQIVKIMETHRVKRLPVMQGEKIVGMITQSDFLPAVANLARRVEGAGANDEKIRDAVLAAMASAPWRPCALNVDVHEGTVGLRGVIKSETARRAALIAAENVAGVRRVEDHLLAVRYPPPEEDYGGGDFVSLQEETSTADDQPL